MVTKWSWLLCRLVVLCCLVYLSVQGIDTPFIMHARSHSSMLGSGVRSIHCHVYVYQVGISVFHSRDKNTDKTIAINLSKSFHCKPNQIFSFTKFGSLLSNLSDTVPDDCPVSKTKPEQAASQTKPSLNNSLVQSQTET
ncbi:hypothetical protein B0T19DRAFT_406193 [Cercophora scortea]|uniref:Uncharacterized protein n=1 Tax=Cercophora scortea TaxID=314031 RepID=A0AAE0MK16_9PEZI|nr:hypothetical protein B0T19DRAFT_406193 [Cercophora scortea]